MRAWSPQWMLLGFIHGVMNTDNTSISGETIDYGPCAFMEAYDPAMVFSSIDQHGRYAYANQPLAALWNLTRLAESLLPVLVEETGSEEAAVAAATEALAAFESAIPVSSQMLACAASSAWLRSDEGRRCIGPGSAGPHGCQRG